MRGVAEGSEVPPWKGDWRQRRCRQAAAGHHAAAVVQCFARPWHRFDDRPAVFSCHIVSPANLSSAASAFPPPPACARSPACPLACLQQVLKAVAFFAGAIIVSRNFGDAFAI